MNQQTTLVGLFKDTYGESVIDAWAFLAPLSKRIRFLPQELRPGGTYHQPIDLVLEHGISHAAAGTVIGTGTSVFFPATAGQTQDAQLTGAQIVARASVSYEAIARSVNDKAAFESATYRVVKRLSEAAMKRLEIQLLHGKKGLGTVESLATETGSSGAYFTVVTISAATWAPGIWAGMVGAFIDLYQSDCSTARQAANINTGVITGTSGWCRISAVDQANRTVTLNYGTARSGWVAGDVLFFGSAVGGTSATEMDGLESIAAVNASSGTFWNIATGTYDLHRANQYSAAGVPSMEKILEACGLLADYGVKGQEVTAVIPTKAFQVLNSDLAALRMFDASYTSARAEAGAATIRYHGQTGPVEILPHSMQKDGMAQILPLRDAYRVGATDLTFITRHGSEEKLILESATSAGSEMRCYSNQSLFVESLRHVVGITGFTY